MVDYFYVTTPQSTTTTTTTTSASTASTSAAAASSTASTSAAAVSSTLSSRSHKSGVSVGMIVGCVVGGLALLLLILWLLLRCKRNKDVTGPGKNPGASIEARLISPYTYASMERREGGRQKSDLITEPLSLPSRTDGASGATGSMIAPYRLKDRFPSQATSPARPSSASLLTQPPADQQLRATSSAPLQALNNDQTLPVLSYPTAASSSSEPSTQQPIIHTDSGMRLNRNLELMELPPVYAAD